MLRLYLSACLGLLVFVLPAPTMPYQQARNLVRQWYGQFLHRETDPSGLSNWTAELAKGTDPAWVLATILSGQEYSDNTGGSIEGLVSGLFQDLLNREPQRGEFSYWAARLARQDRTSVIADLLRQHPSAWMPAPPVSSRYGYRPYFPWRR
jgi:hypothetical protein